MESRPHHLANGDLWRRYARALGDEPLPAALVDMEAFDANADNLIGAARRAGKTLRVASKSVRCPALLHRVLELGGTTTRGLMTYSAQETRFLTEQGFDDLLLAYPTVHPRDLDVLVGLALSGKTASVACDCVEHLEALDAAAASAGTTLRVTLDVDVSYRPMLGVHLGVRRSPLHGAPAALELADRVKRYPNLLLDGVLTYEAQIAGLPDREPGAGVVNGAKRLMKAASRRDVEATRAEIALGLRARGMALRLFNGGGTGSMGWSSADPSLTEVTAGSGLLGSHLFDNFRDSRSRPAAYFALQVVRVPSDGLVTCHGGGLVASGEAGRDRLPVPALPPGLELLPLEGAGEVQTPLKVGGGAELHPGDPVFFRHAKAGELAEHFNAYLLVRGDAVESRALTYRGHGQAFLG